MNKKLVLALLAAGALSAHAASSVEIAAGATAADIQSAIDTIDEGGTVRFPAGTWTLSATLVVNRGVTVEGAGAALTILDFNKKCSGFQISHEDAKVSKLRIYQGLSTAQTSGGGVTLSNGEISECLIDSCVYKGNEYQNGGGGIRLSGGRAFRCEITGCYVDSTFGHGGAVFFSKGGVVEECDIHGNIGKTGNDNISYNSATVALFKGGTLQNSKIHHNQRRTVPGVKIDTSGTVRNCLIYGNSCYDQHYNHGGGLYMTGGTVEYCTVFGNVQKESVGAEAGLFCSGGTVKNSIFFGNGPEGWTYCSCTVSGSPTISNNVFDIVPDGYASVNVEGDPLFTNAATGDFTISSSASPACGCAVPIADVTTDIAGATRSATAPTCGAYEFGGSPVEPEEPEAPTLGEVTVTPKTTSAAISGSITSVGNNGATECDVYLALNGAAATKLGTSAAGPFSYSVSGLTAETEYSYTLSISNNATTAMGAETSGSFTTTAAPSGLKPSGDTTGATDRQSIQSAIDAAAAESPAGTVTLGEGTFVIDAQLNVTGGVALVGQGRDKTIIEPVSGASIRCVFVDEEASVEGLTLRNGKIDDNGGGVSLVSGTVRDCCISNCQTITGQRWGGGVYMTGGTVEDCLIVDCKITSGHYQWGGGGVCMLDGQLVRCEIKGCQTAGTYGHANALFMKGGVADGCDIHHNDGGNGGNVDWNSSVVLLYNGGTLQNSKIHDNTRSNVPGVKIDTSGTVRNCLIYNNVIPDQNTYTFVGGAVYMKNGGTVEYCTVYGNVVSRTNQGQSGLFCSGGTVRNSIFWGNGPVGWTDATCTVSGSPTISNNVFDIVPGGYASVNVAGDPLFTNAATGDFTILYDASPACGYAVPIVGVTTDILGATRSATAPTCGAYEFGSTPPSPTRTFHVDCEQATDGAHGKFPITITTNWLAAAFGSICPGGIVPDGKIADVEAALNAADAVNGLNHVWMNYVLGAMLPGDEDGRIWIRADQTSDPSALRFSTHAFSPIQDCGFSVRFRLPEKTSADDDFVRGDTYSASSTFDVSVASDTLTHRVIDMIFVPDGYDTSYEYVTTVNTAGVLKVVSDKKVNLLSAPWCGFSPTNNPAVKATDFVKAACLSENDLLYVYDNEHQNYIAWAVQPDGTWAAVKTYVLANGVAAESAAEATQTNDIPRGTGFWLERKDPTKPIFLYGQVDASPVTTTLAPGFNLIANPYPNAFDALKLTAPAKTGDTGDRIVIPTGGAPINAYYENGSWGWYQDKEVEIVEGVWGVSSTWTTEGLTVPAGQGFWYLNSGTDAVELAWPTSAGGKDE